MHCFCVLTEISPLRTQELRKLLSTNTMSQGSYRFIFLGSRPGWVSGVPSWAHSGTLSHPLVVPSRPGSLPTQGEAVFIHVGSDTDSPHIIPTHDWQKPGHMAIPSCMNLRRIHKPTTVPSNKNCINLEERENEFEKQKTIYGVGFEYNVIKIMVTQESLVWSQFCYWLYDMYAFEKSFNPLLSLSPSPSPLILLNYKIVSVQISLMPFYQHNIQWSIYIQPDSNTLLSFSLNLWLNFHFKWDHLFYRFLSIWAFYS